MYAMPKLAMRHPIFARVLLQLILAGLVLVAPVRADEPATTTPSAEAAPPKIKLIYDGDIGPDPCDFTTLSMLHEYHRHGLIELLGVAGEAPDPHLASTFSIYNQLYKQDIPIGISANKTGGVKFSDAVAKLYQKVVADTCHADPNKTIFEKFATDETQTTDDVLNSVELYRKLLAAADDNSVVIYAAGPLFNFPLLLASPGDKYSPHTGERLLRDKVKQFVFMGGNFPDSVKSGHHGSEGAEYNWHAWGHPSVTKSAIEGLAKLGKPMIYIGFEQGIRVHVGREIAEKLGRKHPTTESYYLYRSTAKIPPDAADKAPQLMHDNPAFDDLGLFVAVEGGVGKYFREVRGHVQVNEKGANTWVADDDGNEAYITIIQGQEAALRKIMAERITGSY